MASLIKQHFFTIDVLSYLLVAGLIIGGYFIYMPPTFLFIMTSTTLPIVLHYYNDKSKSDRFLISLPVSIKAIVHSKYLFAFIMICLVILIQGIAMLSTEVFDGNQYTYDWRDIVGLLCTATIIISIIFPIYHFFKSFIVATAVVIILFLVGFFSGMDAIVFVMDLQDVIIFKDLDPGLVLVIEEYIPYEPYSVLIIASILLLYISIKTSVYLFSVKDS